MKTYLVTGGAGFIGSNFIHYMFEKYGDDIRIINVDLLTYAGNLENLADIEDNANYSFVKADICDTEAISEIFEKNDVDVVVHFAAESHVDRSIRNPEVFARTNVIGNSMEPGLYSGQHIMINRLVYNISMPKRGDVVAFVPNGNEDTHISVKRIIGLPGETVQIKDGYVYIDGVLLDEQGAYDKIADPGLLLNEVTLEDDQFIVLGDNRNFSEDSRSGNIGIVKSSFFVGKVWFKLSKNLENLGLVR